MSSDGKMGPSRSAMKPPQPFSPDFQSTKKTAPSFNLGSVGVMSPSAKGGDKGDQPTADKLKKLDTATKGRSASAAPSLKGGQGAGKPGADAQSQKSKESENYKEMSVEQCDVRIYQVQQAAKKLEQKIKQVEKNSLMTAK